MIESHTNIAVRYDGRKASIRFVCMPESSPMVIKTKTTNMPSDDGKSEPFLRGARRQAREEEALFLRHNGGDLLHRSDPSWRGYGEIENSAERTRAVELPLLVLRVTTRGYASGGVCNASLMAVSSSCPLNGFLNTR